MSTATKQGCGISPGEFLAGWWNVLNGRAPLLSIEITRERPLYCPGCYAYGQDHLGVGAPTLREVSDFRGDALINGALDLVRKHRPLHVSLVGRRTDGTAQGAKSNSVCTRTNGNSHVTGHERGDSNFKKLDDDPTASRRSFG